MLIMPMEIINVVYFENGELKILKDATDLQKKIYQEVKQEIEETEKDAKI